MTTTKPNDHRAKPKERGIILDAAEVRGILEGRRSQLRRVVVPQPGPQADIVRFEDRFACNGLMADIPNKFKSPFLCPYGQAGDRLWVRETWATDERGEEMADGVVYRADGEFKAIDNTPESADLWVTAHDGGKHKGWRSPATMPRWASRILLEITAVRVQQLQDITEADAIAEGWIPDATPSADGQDYLGKYARDLFAVMYWDFKYSKGQQWDDNHWIWVIEFKQVQ